MFSQLPAYHRIGKAAYKNDLSNTIAFDKHLNSPHQQYRTIHVAGTNGKGSVAHMLASVLMEAGWKTGLYTSPHLKDFRERIRVNGAMIPEEYVTDFIGRNAGFIGELRPSFFEMTVAMAFEYFADRQVDVAVIETGLGGRLDSTNIITPVLSVITNIGHDHMDLLGDSIEKVAEEKAGIIKPGIPVVIGETREETREIFLRKAEQNGSVIFFADQNYKCRLSRPDWLKQSRNYEITELPAGRQLRGTIDLQGDYQEQNIPMVFQSYKVLGKIFGLKHTHLEEGIAKTAVNTGLMGRWQILGTNPLVICDTGHNLEGIRRVLDQLEKIQKNRIHFVLGFSSEKDVDQMIQLFPTRAMYYFTKATVPRALDENELREKALAHGLHGESFGDVASALKSARENASGSDVIYIGGSTFIVADALSTL